MTFKRQLGLAGLATVFVDRAPNFLDADTVLATNRSGAREAVEHLIGIGHRRIGPVPARRIRVQVAADEAHLLDAAAQLGDRVRHTRRRVAGRADASREDSSRERLAREITRSLYQGSLTVH